MNRAEIRAALEDAERAAGAAARAAFTERLAAIVAGDRAPRPAEVAEVAEGPLGGESSPAPTPPRPRRRR